MGKAARHSTYPFASVFQKQVPDLSAPDSDGWSAGTCPYCGLTGAFKVNLVTGKWLCLPDAANDPSSSHLEATGRGR
jgi:hypothetical protein